MNNQEWREAYKKEFGYDPSELAPKANSQPMAPTHCPICGAGVREVGEKDFESANHHVVWLYFDCGGYMQSWDGAPYMHVAKLKCPDIEKAFEKLQAECERLRVRITELEHFNTLPANHVFDLR